MASVARRKCRRWREHGLVYPRRRTRIAELLETDQLPCDRAGTWCECGEHLRAALRFEHDRRTELRGPQASAELPYRMHGRRRAQVGRIARPSRRSRRSSRARIKKPWSICPKSVLFNWTAEVSEFRPDLRVATYAGARRTLDASADLVITSYPILRNDIETLAAAAWDTVILDESQTIKNPDSQVARAAYKLRGGWRLTLSGTPVENRLDELWSQLHFTNPGLLGGRADFSNAGPSRSAMGDDDAAARLRERIRPFSAPAQARCREGSAAAHRLDHVRRARRDRARHLRRDPRRDPARDRQAARIRRRGDRRARGAAAAAPGRVPSRAAA